MKRVPSSPPGLLQNIYTKSTGPTQEERSHSSRSKERSTSNSSRKFPHNNFYTPHRGIPGAPHQANTSPIINNIIEEKNPSPPRGHRSIQHSYGGSITHQRIDSLLHKIEEMDMFSFSKDNANKSTQGSYMRNKGGRKIVREDTIRKSVSPVFRGKKDMGSYAQIYTGEKYNRNKYNRPGSALNRGFGDGKALVGRSFTKLPGGYGVSGSSFLGEENLHSGKRKYNKFLNLNERGQELNFENEGVRNVSFLQPHVGKRLIQNGRTNSDMIMDTSNTVRNAMTPDIPREQGKSNGSPINKEFDYK